MDRGIIDVSIGIDQSIKVGDKEIYSFEINTFNNDCFKEEFNVLFKEKLVKKSGDKGSKKKNKKNNNNTQSGLALPNILLVKEEELESKDMNIDSALKIIRGEENDFYINADNKYIKDYLDKEKDNIKKDSLFNSYKLSLVLFGISILNVFENLNNEDDINNFNEIVEYSSKAFAQILFPIQELNKNLENN